VTLRTRCRAQALCSVALDYERNVAHATLAVSSSTTDKPRSISARNERGTAQQFNVPGKAVILNAHKNKTDVIVAEAEIPYGVSRPCLPRGTRSSRPHSRTRCERTPATTRKLFAYEEKLRPFIDAVQAEAVRMAETLVPRTEKRSANATRRQETTSKSALRASSELNKEHYRAGISRLKRMGRPRAACRWRAERATGSPSRMPLEAAARREQLSANDALTDRVTIKRRLLTPDLSTGAVIPRSSAFGIKQSFRHLI
jgi:hypothetical protein